MAINLENYKNIRAELGDKVVLVAVSKTRPAEDIKTLYDQGQRDFGENYVQELIDKQPQLPADIHWHYIGHLQSNKVKYIAPFVHLIHGVDSFKLLKEISRQAQKQGRVINCLLQVHIAQEETKFGLDETELDALLNEVNSNPLQNIAIKGLMGMASFTKHLNKVRSEFKELKRLHDKVLRILPQASILSMGMSSDYKIAVEEGSTLVRIGSLLFGERK